MEKSRRCWPDRLHLRVRGTEANLPNPMLSMQTPALATLRLKTRLKARHRPALCKTIQPSVLADQRIGHGLPTDKDNRRCGSTVRAHCCRSTTRK
jgi:hypothetical protein